MHTLFALLLAASTLLTESASREPRTISVTGEAEVKVVPDEVNITLGVETLDKDLGRAKKDNDERMKRIFASAKSHGVEAKRIATDHVNIEPRYEWQNSHNVFLGYAVRRSIVVTVRNLSKFDAILTGSLESGANFVHGVQFNTTELRKHRDSARSMAVKAAHEKATAMAKELNQKLGKPRTIVEIGGRWFSGYGSGWGGNASSRYASQTQNTYQNLGGGEAIEGATAPGQIAVNASVQIVFDLE
jgi:uncharacterized protein